MKNKKSVTTIVLYVLAVVLVILGSIQLFQATSYILNSVNQGVVTWGSDFATIISYISQACVSTYSFAVIFYVMGKGYKFITANKEEKEVEAK